MHIVNDHKAGMQDGPFLFQNLFFDWQTQHNYSFYVYHLKLVHVNSKLMQEMYQVFTYFDLIFRHNYFQTVQAKVEGIRLIIKIV